MGEFWIGSAMRDKDTGAITLSIDSKVEAGLMGKICKAAGCSPALADQVRGDHSAVNVSNPSMEFIRDPDLFRGQVAAIVAAEGHQVRFADELPRGWTAEDIKRIRPALLRELLAHSS
jgi:hypothetical protein